MGTLVIPSSVAMVRGAPHEEAAARLARFLLSEKVETMLMDAGYCQLSTRQEGGIAPLTGTPIKGRMSVPMPSSRQCRHRRLIWRLSSEAELPP